jgi:hypothetical protein
LAGQTKRLNVEGFGIVAGGEGFLASLDIDPEGSTQLLHEGVLYVVEKGTETATSVASRYFQLILNNVERLIIANA